MGGSPLGGDVMAGMGGSGTAGTGGSGTAGTGGAGKHRPARAAAARRAGWKHHGRRHRRSAARFGAGRNPASHSPLRHPPPGNHRGRFRAVIAACPANQVVIGFEGFQSRNQNYPWLHSAGGVCGAVSINGLTVTITEAGKLAVVGATNAAAWTRRCPQNQVVIGFDGNAGDWMGVLKFRCAPLLVSGSGTITTGAVTILEGGGRGRGQHLPHNRLRQRPGRPRTGPALPLPGSRPSACSAARPSDGSPGQMRPSGVPFTGWRPHSLLSGFSHHQRPARGCSPGWMARVHGAQPIEG